MYRYNNGQISLTDFQQPMGMHLREDNRWVKKAQTIPWREIEKKYAQLFPSPRAMWQSLYSWLRGIASSAGVWLRRQSSDLTN